MARIIAPRGRAPPLGSRLRIPFTRRRDRVEHLGLTWLFILGYLALQLGIGVWVSRSVRSESDFFLGGRRLGVPLVTFSLCATWFGAETCIGSSGAVYTSGLSGARADPLGYGLCLFLMGLWLARRLWERSLVTLGDLYRQRYGVAVERLAVLVLVPSSLIWGAAQVRAFGQVIAVTTHLPVDLAIGLSAAFVVAYTLLGGLMSDVITDLIQGTVLAIGLLILLAAAVSELGGVGGFLGAMEPSRLSLLGPGETLLQQLDRWMVPVLGSLVAQEAIARLLAARSAETARRGAFLAGGTYLAVGAIPIALGLVGPSLVPGLDDGERFLTTVSHELLPPLLFAVISGALVSAILSTIDSIMLATSALISHNLLLPLLRLESEKKKLLCARAVLLASGAVAFVLALYAESVYALVESASSFGTAGVLVTTLAALYVRRGGSAAAFAALLTGLATTPVARYVLELDAPFLTSIAASAAAYAVFAARPVAAPMGPTA